MTVNLDRIRTLRDKAAEEAARRSAKFYDFKDKRNMLRILPPWEGSEDFFRIFAKHWNLGAEGKTVVYCPKICYEKPCFICEKIERNWKSKPDEATKEWLKSIGASARYYVNVIDLDDLDAGIQIAEFPKTVLTEIFNIMVDSEVGVGDITHMEKGRDIIIDKTGKGIGTRYAVRAKLAASPPPFAISPTDIPNLDNLVRNETYENLKLIWDGKEPLPASAPIGLPAPAAAAGSAVIETIKVGEGAYLTAPPLPDPTVALEVAAEAAATAVTSGKAPAVASPPKCFGEFNESVAACLDCAEQDDCEVKMLENKRAARKATTAAKSAPATPAAVPAPAARSAAPAPGISAEDLMAEMEAAISR